jgi:hypothetical protein
MVWLGHKDLNPDRQNQNLPSCQLNDTPIHASLLLVPIKDVTIGIFIHKYLNRLKLPAVYLTAELTNSRDHFHAISVPNNTVRSDNDQSLHTRRYIAQVSSHDDPT